MFIPEAVEGGAVVAEEALPVVERAGSSIFSSFETLIGHVNKGASSLDALTNSVGNLGNSVGNFKNSVSNLTNTTLSNTPTSEGLTNTNNEETVVLPKKVYDRYLSLVASNQ